MTSKTLILGSESPRRSAILRFFSLPFQQVASEFAEESIPFTGDPIAYAQAISQGKAAALQEKFPQDSILTADTVVYHGGKIYNKPQSKEEALLFLSTLAGSWHQVFTSVTVQKENRIYTQVEETKLLFHPLTPEQIQRYHERFFCLDKAGGYGIQEAGALLVARMEGCYYNVLGLPLTTTKELLLKVGIDLWKFL